MAEEMLSYSPLLMQGGAMTSLGDFMIQMSCELPRARAVAANFANFRA
jgi:hypothetical protein